MRLLRDMKNAMFHYGDALKMISTHRMGNLFFLSLLFYLLIVLISAAFIWLGMDKAIDFLLHLKFFSQLLDWMNQFPWIGWLFKLALFLSSFFVFVSLYKFIFLAIASPLYAYISERTAEKINGQEYPFQTTQFLKDVLRGIQLSLRNFVKQLIWTLLLFTLSFIPLVGFLFSFMIMLLDCYYYGFAMIDYNCERDRLTPWESRQWMMQRKGLALGNGFVFYLAFMIPFIGIIIAAPLSAMAASISYYENKQHE